MVQSTERGLSVISLEREIEAEVRKRPLIHESRPVNFAPPEMRSPELPIPDYVEHRDGATEIGKLSAEAVVREYEATAKEIESIGVDLVERAKQCEAMTRDALAATQVMKETAKRYREEAKRIFIQIEDCSLMTAEVRKTCTELKERIAAPTTAPA